MNKILSVQHAINIKLLTRYFILFFHIKLSKSSVYFIFMKHLNLDAEFLLEIFALCLDFIKFATEKQIEKLSFPDMLKTVPMTE